MTIALLSIECYLPMSQSLKDKRMVLRRIKDRLQPLNVAVAEVAHQDLWQRATLAVVSVNTDQAHLESTLSAVAGEAATARDVELVDQQVELL